MSSSDNANRAETSMDFRLERSKRIRRQMDDIVRLWLEGLTVTLIAQRLGVKRDRVYLVLRFLELKSGRVKWDPTRLYSMTIRPTLEESDAA